MNTLKIILQFQAVAVPVGFAICGLTKLVPYPRLNVLMLKSSDKTISAVQNIDNNQNGGQGGLRLAA